MESPFRVNLVGTDGSGKSTVLDLLRAKFESDEQSVVCHNPSGITYPNPIPYESKTNPENQPWEVYGLTRMDRASCVESAAISIAEQYNAVLLGDRDFSICHPVYYPVLMAESELADITQNEWQNRFVSARKCGPADSIFWLDVDPGVAVERIENGDRTRIQPHEKQETIVRLRAGYAEMERTSAGGIIRIDTTSCSAEEVRDQIWAILQSI